MTRSSFASHPFLLGFEDLDNLLERTARNGADGYPPFNVEQRGDSAYRITLAVAGFAEEQLSITLEDGNLTIRGEQESAVEDREFLHRGIATRKFQRSFVLDPRVEVTGATLHRGLLMVDLVRRQPETRVQRIRIGGPEQKEKNNG